MIDLRDPMALHNYQRSVRIGFEDGKCDGDRIDQCTSREGYLLGYDRATQPGSLVESMKENFQRINGQEQKQFISMTRFYNKQR